MLKAYNRERQLMPILVEATRRGVRCDRERLATDIAKYEDALGAVEGRIWGRLGGGTFNIGSGAELARALDSAGAVTEPRYTATGRRSTARDVLLETVSDPELRAELVYWRVLTTCLSTFMKPWLEKSIADGRLHPNWNQVRSVEKRSKGTRTGRLSSDDPNFQNLPNEFDGLVIPEGLPHPPYCRIYILPEEGHVWCKRDFSSQEVRIASHFEDDRLLAAYQDDPALDPHEMTRELILQLTGQDFPRKHVKITGFQILYGGGAPAISQNVGCDLESAARLKYSYFQAMPGIEALVKDINKQCRLGNHITTWGGRKYYAEARDYAYKVVNYLIQGSAADQTKDCIIHWNDSRRAGDIFMATVHDEINISCPEDDWEEGMTLLRTSMDRDLFDCPMQSEGFVGPNWSELTKIEGEY